MRDGWNVLDVMTCLIWLLVIAMRVAIYTRAQQIPIADKVSSGEYVNLEFATQVSRATSSTCLLRARFLG
jgi:hypothetical protein